MSNEAINWAYRQTGLVCGAKFVLVALADFADHEWSCFPSQERLADMTGQTVRSVRNHLKALTDAGYVRREPRRGSGGQRTSDRYYLLPAESAGSAQPATSVEPTGKIGTNQPANVAGEPLVNHQEPKSDLRPDVEGLLDHLDERLAANGARLPSRTKTNRDSARLMLDVDGRTLEEAHQLIDWATRDEFWRANILSMSKFRAKYDQLRMKANLYRRPADVPEEPRPMPDVDPDDVVAWVAAMEARSRG